MNINSTDSDLTSMLIITTNESGQQKPITSIPTIYPNDYDFDLDTEFQKTKSTASRSFSRPAKTLGQEHRNKSVPHSLQVCQILYLRVELKYRMNQATHTSYTSMHRGFEPHLNVNNEIIINWGFFMRLAAKLTHTIFLINYLFIVRHASRWRHTDHLVIFSTVSRMRMRSVPLCGKIPETE